MSYTRIGRELTAAGQKKPGYRSSGSGRPYQGELYSSSASLALKLLTIIAAVQPVLALSDGGEELSATEENMYKSMASLIVYGSSLLLGGCFMIAIIAALCMCHYSRLRRQAEESEAALFNSHPENTRNMSTQYITFARISPQAPVLADEGVRLSPGQMV